MDHPKRQIPGIIHSLTEGSPVEQKKTLETYFTQASSFAHPLCRVPSFSHISLPLLGEVNSRWLIWMIYRWYKILSPRIILSVDCSEYNQETQTLFVQIHQQFSLFFIPFYKSNVALTTKLHLIQQKSKYYIQSQEDLYQTNEVVKFFWPGGATVIWFWQLFATFLCIVGAVLLAPVTWSEQKTAGNGGDYKKAAGEVDNNMEEVARTTEGDAVNGVENSINGVSAKAEAWWGKGK